MDDDAGRADFVGAAAGKRLEAAVTALFVTGRHLEDGGGAPGAAEKRRAWRLWVSWAARHRDPTLARCLDEPGPFRDHVVVDLPGSAADTPFVTVLPVG
jgi:hypothetical protein